MSLDRRIRAVLARIVEGNGGEAVAALAALERMLPQHTTLAEVLFVGLHYTRQDLVDPSLVAENRRLAGDLENSARRLESMSERVARLEKAVAEAQTALSTVRAELRGGRLQSIASAPASASRNRSA